MRNRGELIIGSTLVLLGLIFLLGTLFNINIWAICWPIGLILLGAWLIARPMLAGSGRNVNVLLISDVDRRGKWDVRDEEFWIGIGDLDLDMLTANIPPGETRIKIYSLIDGVSVYVPESVGVAVQANGFVLDTDFLGQECDNFLVPFEAVSENYETAECRIRIEQLGLITELKVRRG